MNHSFQGLSSWWFATMTPQRAPVTTITQRETMRKRRLLSLIIVFSLLLILLSTTATSVIAFTPQLSFGWIECGMLLLAFWLNRQGYPLGASLLLFLPEGCNLLLAAHTLSLANPISLLWTLSPMALLLVMAGLFLPAWMIVLMAAGETLVIGYYLLVARSSLLIFLLPATQRWNFLIYLGGVIATSAMIGIFYMVTTKKALIQADRATELEQAYRNLEAAHATIQRQALTDMLTNLPNHRAVMEQLSREEERARRYGRPFSLLFFDADHFKQVNDTYGHATGDAVLRQLGERAGSILRGGDTLGRFGGEEFVILLPEADTPEASVVAERLRAAVTAVPIALAEVTGGIALTVSIGIAAYPTNGVSEQDVLTQADQAMYVAKRLGRNQVRTAEEAMQMGTDVELIALLQQEGSREPIGAERLRETYTEKMIGSLLALLERRDQGMCQHAQSVRDLAISIAQVLHQEQHQVSRIGMAGLLHDIGKVGIPDALLQKTGHLSVHERMVLREHAELGAHILEASPFLSDLMPAVRYHHERWDGRDNDSHLRGEKIPLAARILAVAEAYDAMQRTSAYQASRTSQEALAEVQRCASRQFDPTIVQALATCVTTQPKQEQILQTAN